MSNNNRNHLSRTYSNTSTIATITVKAGKTLGRKTRDIINKTSKKCFILKKYLFKNFIMIHYFYIITNTLIGSILIYPVGNIRYIDALFMAGSSATQGGLNTVDLNMLTTYQQIIIYLICFFCSSIFIHSILASVRLYWFERHFDGIEDYSKQNFKMRRTRSLLEKELSKTQQYQKATNKNQNTFHENLFSGTFINRDSPLMLSATTSLEYQESQSTSNSISYSDSNTENSYLDNILFYKGKNSQRNDIKDIKTYKNIKTLRILQKLNMYNKRKFSSLKKMKLQHFSPNKIKSYNKKCFRNLSFQKNNFYLVKNYLTYIYYRRSIRRDLDLVLNNEQGSVSSQSDTTLSTFQRELAEDETIILPSPNEINPINADISTLKKNPTTIRFEITKPQMKGALKQEKKASNSYKNDENITALQRFKSSFTNEKYLGTKINVWKDGHTERSFLTLLEKTNKRSKQRRNNEQSYDEPLSGNHSLSFNTDSEASFSASLDNISTVMTYDLPPLSARTMSTGYLSYEPKLDRNSIFIGLTKSQREELGGVEYRALKLLCKIVFCYYFGINLLAFVFLIPWAYSAMTYKNIILEFGSSPGWWAAFTGMSSSNNVGLTLTPNSMASFNTAPYPLIVIMCFVILGNTGFPIFLRFIIWGALKITPESSNRKESLGYLLDHPRRCFTLLFPKAVTWWLLFTLFTLTVFDWLLFIILDLNISTLDPLSKGYRVLAGLFQGIATRTPGFALVDVSVLHPTLQVTYLLMMYISVFPLAISIRRTNVYEEQSLGIYENESTSVIDRSSSFTSTELETQQSLTSCSSGECSNTKKLSTKSFIGSHIRKQLSFDLWFLFVALFIVSICEGSKIRDIERPSFNLFSVLFELVSAYCTVGMSLGYPGTTPSFTGQFSKLSKLVIIILLIRGRHRGLPNSIDRAIILPSEKLERLDIIVEEQSQRQKQLPNLNDPASEYVNTKYKEVLKVLENLKFW
ncbi:hypothetical protein TBLA_0D05650 [Henningerozyma blattae CBS 6284]|uniref:Potassium transport protein n=1 Tax=Henningerozyma blattae (strain ATCC 34711 / CBS 6284 / DSM 70876 / NBRC 10599 / NRRL Y-10934 / UCD 77-7) TaxID=1071380 RepID=I2H3V5_HENB6|nr:hypothetical protein TBLA_0D05650 [Tetrapisispora blattae CBS 6284]CCH61057.1 hypothetical protein TBLA_0D05650 [Tetrapisispora blattae CBS 6284]